MKNIKKSLFAIVSAVLVTANLASFAACGVASGGGDGGGEVDTNKYTYETPDTVEITDVVPYDGSDVTVTFYHTMGANLRAVLDKYIPQFNAMYPNITIDHQQMGDYNGVRDQISKELTAKNSPSIAYCYPDHVALYNKAKAVLTLDSYIESKATVTKDDGTTEIMGLTKEQREDFVLGYYVEGRAYGDDKMYTLPYSKSTEVLYYNKTYFEQKGYEVPCRPPRDEHFSALAFWWAWRRSALSFPICGSVGGRYRSLKKRLFVSLFCFYTKNCQSNPLTDSFYCFFGFRLFFCRTKGNAPSWRSNATRRTSFSGSKAFRWA